MRVAVDVMGGDRAPAAILQGCWDAAALLTPDDRVLLVGDELVIRAGLAASELSAEKLTQYQVIPTTQVIGMDDSPVEAVRNKPKASINVMCDLVKKGEADVAISAGNTGACVAAAQLKMRTLPGVSRPGIAVVLPTFYGPVVICDVGANITPQPRHLQQYAIMAGAYGAAVAGIENPRVGILSIGEEDAKGTEMVKEARALMRDEPLINFIGNIEGRDIFKGVVDVVVCDGFVGNIILKFTEGITEGLFQTILAELQEFGSGAVDQFKPVMKKIYAKHDWQEYGGAPLLGVGGYCLICHGRSEARAIKNAIRVGQQLCRSGVNQKIVERIARSIPGRE
ncbi:phosphate acyltransferase PlsX [Humisphaera borealis]|uniref:Phosphate acyltransferase n=1 Tax=Humisphaera borealis TaxID=2807512 RepID=A0A7M2WU66_9BACT|nr:phosphate acyltransferase PlsX [Humisphaera borealis]QOV88341.1 phosphate acyltransferase PlsX [Humisphaera borealis]